MIDEEQRKRHWRLTFRLMVVSVALFALLAVIVPLTAPGLDAYYLLRFPLGYFAVAHGTILGLIVAVYWSAARQDKLDRRHGLTNEF